MNVFAPTIPATSKHRPNDGCEHRRSWSLPEAINCTIVLTCRICVSRDGVDEDRMGILRTDPPHVKTIRTRLSRGRDPEASQFRGRLREPRATSSAVSKRRKPPWRSRPREVGPGTSLGMRGRCRARRRGGGKHAPLYSSHGLVVVQPLAYIYIEGNRIRSPGVLG